MAKDGVEVLAQAISCERQIMRRVADYVNGLDYVAIMQSCAKALGLSSIEQLTDKQRQQAWLNAILEYEDENVSC